MRSDDDRLPLAQAAKILPGRPHASSVWRFCRKGIKARNGERVYLRHERWGGVIYTSGQWLQEFAERLAAADIEHFEETGRTPPASIATRTPAQARRDNERADTELTAVGIHYRIKMAAGTGGRRRPRAAP